jgi:hypothetical protein
MLNPTTSQDIYFMGQGILKTGHSAGFPPPVLDAFSAEVNSSAIGSVNDAPSVKLGFSSAESLFNNLWKTGMSYDSPGGNTTVTPSIVDRDLTDNATVTTSRYYKWSIPFTATAFHFGGSLPLGRLVVDIRILDGGGRVIATSGRQMLLQNGQNTLTFSVASTDQGLVSFSGDLTDLSNRARITLFTTGSPLVPGDVLTVTVQSDVPTPHVFIVSVTVGSGDTMETVAAKVAAGIQLVEPSPLPGGPGPYRIQAADTMPVKFSDEFRMVADNGLLTLARVDGTNRASALSLTLQSSVPAATAHITGGALSASEGSITFGGEVPGGDWIRVTFTNGRGRTYEIVAESEPGDSTTEVAEKVATALNGTTSTDESVTAFADEYEAANQGAKVTISAKEVDELLDAIGDGLRVTLLGAGVSADGPSIDAASEGLPATLACQLNDAARPGDSAYIAFDANGQTYEAYYAAESAETAASFAAGLAEAVNNGMADYEASVDGDAIYISAKTDSSDFDFPAGTIIEIFRPDLLDISEVVALTGGGNGPNSSFATGTIVLTPTGSDVPHPGQKVSVSFTNRAGDKYLATYLLKATDIGGSVSDTLSSLANGLAAVLGGAISEGGKPFSDDYQATSNASGPGSLTIQALSSDTDFETSGAGGLAASRLVPLSVSVSGPLRVTAPED